MQAGFAGRRALFEQFVSANFLPKTMFSVNIVIFYINKVKCILTGSGEKTPGDEISNVFSDCTAR